MKLEFHPQAELELTYSVTSDVLRIEVVAHQSRRPGYWKSRLRG